MNKETSINNSLNEKEQNCVCVICENYVANSGCPLCHVSGMQKVVLWRVGMIRSWMVGAIRKHHGAHSGDAVSSNSFISKELEPCLVGRCGRHWGQNQREAGRIPSHGVPLQQEMETDMSWRAWSVRWQRQWQARHHCATWVRNQ